ncbi:MAG: heparinase II/III domain-containing protein, partial [Gemmatimonadales bacterium]
LHRCPSCDRVFCGPRHHAHWARAQHLWIAERAAHLAALHAVTQDARYAGRARELLAAYYRLYFELPNRDNVLGPSHLFFSTYLESIWVLDYLSAAFLLREMHVLDEDDIATIDAIADEAASIIAEFNEGMSNRQTWNSAALTAIATWFGDEDLAVNAIESRTGLVGHLADGFGTDGMWWEGENYHLFALRGLMIGLQWAGTAGADLLESNDVAAQLGHALMAPADSALPDFTFPARKDSRYGVSLAHPAYLECWEAGLAALAERAPAELTPWLVALYRIPARLELTYDAYLHESGEPPRTSHSRSELSWWALLVIAPVLPDVPSPWSGQSRLLEQQGLAILRHGDRYVSLECGASGGGHGHPDRLHLTVHAEGVHWLPDPGTGSYVSRDLFWYRSTLAHNAPLIDGADQAAGEPARCAAFAVNGDWSWVVGTWGGVRRVVVAGPEWILDITHLDSDRPRQLDLPWHLPGELDVRTDGGWQPLDWVTEFVSDAVKFEPATGVATVHASATAADRTLTIWFAGDGELLRANGPGLPGTASRRPFYLRRANSNSSFVVSLLDLSASVTGLDFDGSLIRISHGNRQVAVEWTPAEAVVATGTARTVLSGVRPVPLAAATFVLDRPPITRGEAIWIDTDPPLDGSTRGFNRSAPLRLDEEFQYYRSEAPFPGADEISATAYVNWTDTDLFVAVEVAKSDSVFPPPDAPPLDLDNEPDDINADGIQVYYRGTDHRVHSWLVRPLPNGTLRQRPIGDTPADDDVTGAWAPTPNGYCVTVRFPCPHLATLRRTERLAFDIIVNEMRPGRTRRAGQLIWSGGPGWVYLRGDRHDPAHFGELELRG